MKTLILALAAMLIAAPAVAAAQDYAYHAYQSLPGGYAAPIGPDPNFPDDMNILDDCQDTLGLRPNPNAEMARGEICGRAVFDWLFDTKRLSDSDLDKDGVVGQAVSCGARLILKDGDPAKTAAAILSAEFDTACGEPPAIM